MLNLDSNRLARFLQNSPVYLTQRGTGQGFFVKFLKEIAYFASEFLLNSRFDVLKGRFGCLHQHGSEGHDVLGRNQLVELAYHLAQFDVGAGIITKAPIKPLAGDPVRLPINLLRRQIIHRHPSTCVAAADSADQRIQQLLGIVEERWVLVGCEHARGEEKHSIKLK